MTVADLPAADAPVKVYRLSNAQLSHSDFGRMNGPGPMACEREAFSITLRKRSIAMLQTIYIQPAIALAAGILILLMPRLLNYIVALYLIAVGILGLLDNLSI